MQCMLFIRSQFSLGLALRFVGFFCGVVGFFFILTFLADFSDPLPTKSHKEK